MYYVKFRKTDINIMIRFLIMVSAIIFTIIVLNHAKKETDKAYNSKVLIRLCGTYLGKTHTRTSRSPTYTDYLHVLNNGKKQK